jgi:hypothetical protein
VNKLNRCEGCDALVPRSGVCPYCTRALPRWIATAATVIGGAGLAMTLSACYGAAYYPEQNVALPPPSTCADATLDTDGDGHCQVYDCDESDPRVQTGCDSGPQEQQIAE